MFKTRSLEIHVVKVAIYKFAAFELRFYKCSEPDILKSAICITGRTVSDNCFFEIYRIKYAIIKFVPMFSCSFKIVPQNKESIKALPSILYIVSECANKDL